MRAHQKSGLLMTFPLETAPSCLVEDPDDFISTLLIDLEDKNVIPIIGPELLTVNSGGTEIPLYRYIADHLADALGIKTSDIAPDYTLNDVVAYYVHQKRGKLVDVLPRIRKILNDGRFQPPEALRKLARIRSFRLFVTTTFDSLLEKALNEERGGGGGLAEVISYAPNDPGSDLDADWDNHTNRTVFHLFGRAEGGKKYVLTDEDTLEYLHALQSVSRQPARLFDHLKSNHLLLLGCPFPDWLARFFLRTAKSSELSRDREKKELLADSRSRSDPALAAFLSSYSSNTKLFPGTAIEFVDRLSAAWDEKYQQDGNGSSPDPDRGGESSVALDAVFLSYSRADLPAVQRLSDGMSEITDVWFDSKQLEAGDSYERKIRKHIRECSLFVPVISRNSADRREGFFRLEWELARERNKRIGGKPFIIPVIIDDTRAEHEGVPDEFWQFQVSRLPDGSVTPDFLLALRNALRAARS